MERLGATDLAFLQQLLEQLPDSPFFVKDSTLRYVAANAAMAELCGVTRTADLIGRRAGEFFEPEHARRYENMDRDVLARGGALTNVLDLTEGRRRRSAWLLFSRIPVRAPDGSVVGVAAISRRLRLTRRKHETYQRLRLVAEEIRASVDRPLRLPRLCELAGLSKSQLEREFHRLFCQSPREFHQAVRMQRALELLETPLSVAAVGYECGYGDQSAFTRRFARTFGITPSRYRQRIKRGDRVDRFAI